MLAPLASIAGDTILPLADARAALNIIGDEHDARLTRARNGAIDFAERYTGIVFLVRGFRWTLDRFSGRTQFPVGPVTGVDAVSYRDSDGNAATLIAADWYLADGVLTLSLIHI